MPGPIESQYNGAALYVRAVRGIRAVASVVTDAPIGARGQSFVRVGLLLRYYVASHRA